jgi:hypothetical protein
MAAVSEPAPHLGQSSKLEPKPLTGRRIRWCGVLERDGDWLVVNVVPGHKSCLAGRGPAIHDSYPDGLSA